MHSFIIESSAPTRIDLAGGTIDIWPLYLFHESATTINLAINLYARVRIELLRGSQIIIESKDLKKRIKFYSINKIKHNHLLSIITRGISFFKPESGLYIETYCESPAGAGLSGSSAMNIALCSALNRLTGDRFSREELITIAKNIESQVIKAPTGYQDYYPAMFGGLNMIELSIEGVKAVKVKIDYEELEKRITLCYSGISRNSGINNWEVFKRHIDGNKEIFKNLESIRKTAIKMKSAIIDSDYDKIAKLIGDEWKSRKMLWKGVSTPTIDRLIDIGMKNGAMSAKVCGAGGGGCIIFLSKPERQREIMNAIKKANTSLINKPRIINYKIDRKGIKIK